MQIDEIKSRLAIIWDVIQIVDNGLEDLSQYVECKSYIEQYCSALSLVEGELKKLIEE